MKQRGHALLLIVFLIALVVGGILYYQKSSLRQGYVGQAVQPSLSPKDETVNWKTYTENNLWEIKYPQGLHKMATDKNSKYVAFSDGNSTDFPLIGGDVYLQIAWGETNHSYDDLFKKEVGIVYKDLSTKNTVLKKLIVGGYPAVMQLEEIVINGHPSGEKDNGKGLNVYIKGSLNVRITLESTKQRSPEDFTDKYLPVFNQILSTFKFLDQK